VDQGRWQAIKGIFGAVVELETSARASYLQQACAEDAELRAEVESLLKAHAVSDGFIEQPAGRGALGVEVDAPGPPWIGRRVGFYRIVEEIGRGGMSEVYKAVRDDDEYHKEVAVKVLRRGYNSRSLLRHFKVEKQILATLDHPNIARLLDGGSTEEGLPYLVMDYIRGQPIDEYCAQRRLGLAARLELFRALCGAVQHVHQHLMVHGDLKCSNVLVANDGTVKLLDFGIARLLNPTPAPADPKATALLALTPEYASPEQIRGGPITTASDVYSLGVVLFRLITGALPYRLPNGFSYDLAARICEAEPPPPSGAARRSETAEIAGFWRELTGDLDNIALMALQKDPAKRYPSVEQLNEDVRRHLHGFPVVARSASILYMLAKFVSRHRVGLAAAVLLMLTLIGGIVATGWEAHIAGIERARAERHFEEVRKLADTFMFDVNGAIENLPGSTAARQMLVVNSLKYLDGLSAESANNASLQRELAIAYEKVADIQGGFRSANLGDAPGAIASYRKALGIRAKLIAASPSAQDVRRELLRTYGKLAELLSDSGDQQEAIKTSRLVLEQARKLSAAPESTAADRRNLGNAYLSLGWLLAKSGEVDHGLALAYQGIGIYQALLESDLHDTRSRRNLAVTYGRLGEVLVNSSRYAEALTAYTKDLDIVREMANADPRNGDLQNIEGYARLGIGDARAGVGEMRAALEEHAQGVSILRALYDADAKDDQARFDLAYALGQASEPLTSVGELQAAERDLQESVEILTRSAGAAGPGLNRAKAVLGVDYFRLGQVSVSHAADPRSGNGRARYCQAARQWFDRSAPILSAADRAESWRAYIGDRAGRIAKELGSCAAAGRL
jgi:serine/threonine protein kinase/tetratricopeptide (TPR) repeat protein